MSWLTAVAAMGGLTALLACALAVANRRLAVSEDPRLEAAEALLPGNNCGAFGHPGCRAFAEAMLRGEAQPGECTVATPAAQHAVGALLGLEVRALEARVARLACAGGDNVARPGARYSGVASCRAAATVAGAGIYFSQCYGTTLVDNTLIAFSTRKDFSFLGGLIVDRPLPLAAPRAEASCGTCMSRTRI